MNKKTIIILVICFILLVLLIAGVTVFKMLSFVMQEKTSITASEFYNKMEDKGYYLQDGTSQFSEYDYIEQVYLAADYNANYQVEFYEFSDDSYASGFFENNKSIFESSKGNSQANTSVNLKNSSKYTLTTDGKYKVISRINNTVIYLNVNEEYKDTVNDLLKDLGY